MRIRHLAVNTVITMLAFSPVLSHSQMYTDKLDPTRWIFDYPTQLTNDEVRQLMIQWSINNYKGICACPYSPDLIGGICGTESAYYKPGGFKIWCFFRDISSEQVYFWKLKYATPRRDRVL